MILKKVLLYTLLSALAISVPTDAQRRSRPGSMKHSASEVENKKKIVNLKCKYIKDGAVFQGPVYMVGDAGGIKIGDAAILFRAGRYILSFDAAKFNVRKYAAMTDEQLRQKGISKYEYETSWEKKKLGEDFDYTGKYATIEQYGQKWLILYNGDTEREYAKIPLNSINDNSFELQEDDMLVRMSCK